MKKSASYIAPVASLLVFALALSGVIYHHYSSNNEVYAAKKRAMEGTLTASSGKQEREILIEPGKGNQIEVLKVFKEGTGSRPERGQWLKVHYVGRFEDGREFDNSYKRGKALKFKFKAGHVIKGFEQGLANMASGGKRTIKIPPQLAYGKRGAPPNIPRNSTLVFDLELLEIED